MKIIGGIDKGKKIISKPPKNLRPTMSKVRESLFNILGEDIKDSSFLELFAGTGAVGMEALSRGAGKVVFVDKNPLAVNSIASVKSSCPCDEIHVIKADACEAIKRLSKKKETFHFIFLDPPYHTKDLDEILPLLGDTNILAENGKAVVEHFFKKTMPRNSGCLSLKKSYKYGDTVLSLYVK